MLCGSAEQLKDSAEQPKAATGQPYDSTEKAALYASLAEVDPWWKHVHDFTVAQLLGDVTGMSILDIGCGDGRTSRKLLEQGAAKVVGIDISETMVALAAHLSPKGAEYMVADASIPHQIGQFELAVSMYVLQYARSYQSFLGFLKTAEQNLKIGGRFCGIYSAYDDTMPLKGYNPVMNASFSRSSAQEWEPISCTLGGSTDSPAVSMTIYSIYPSTFNRAVMEAGFKCVKRHTIALSPEGSDFFDEEDVRRHMGYLYIFEAFK